MKKYEQIGLECLKTGQALRDQSFRIFLILRVAALGCITALVAGAPNVTTRIDARETKKAESRAAAQSSSNEMQSFNARIITIRRMGMEPREISIPKGPAMLAVYNRTGLGEVTLQIDRVGGNRLLEETLSAGKADWKGFANLSPGVYVLSEAHHPEWSCRITVTPD